MAKHRPDRLSKQLVKQAEANDTRGNLTVPSPNPATNLLIADIVIRGASTLFRRKIEQRVAKASADNEEQAQELLDGRTLITTLGLYSASKLATRSPVGLGVVAGGLVLKALYDRGRALQLRRRRKEIAED
ncbi:hypothetical protein [Erythrobacter sp. JK5]|uniref:hypothetical protein n=1 Tax=Erythrobacter sp. JK5 TaxID=2829500 RepID=UPI001BAC70D4|nr:hypothetical protein [Erythrobacter sp. JK5]QUL37921.1 hypothetical protein KDC96_00330 [Erythrobacter sp. JK5]